MCVRDVFQTGILNSTSRSKVEWYQRCFSRLWNHCEMQIRKLVFSATQLHSLLCETQTILLGMSVSVHLRVNSLCWLLEPPGRMYCRRAQWCWSTSGRHWHCEGKKACASYAECDTYREREGNVRYTSLIIN
jgi:hypothetical protein